MLSFKDCNIYNNGKIVKKSITIDKKVVEFNNTNLVDINNDYIILPGFVDKHTHGANNSDCMYPNLEDLENICITKAKEGITSFLATTMTASIEDTLKAINNIVNFINTNKLGKMIRGIHLEGPFLCGNYKGAQPESHLIRGTINNFKSMVGENIEYIKQITIAPECCDDDLLVYLHKNNICMSIGHSNASYDMVKHAMSLGLNSITHTFNAQSPLHHREIGVVGSAMLEDSLFPEVICDLVHVSPNALRLLYKCNKNICLITDSMEASHLEDGNYELGGQKVILKGNEARLENNTLAGSVLKMNIACKNIKDVLNITYEEVVNLATLNPSKCLNLEVKQNDFVVIDKEYNVIMTILEGEIIYKR